MIESKEQAQETLDQVVEKLNDVIEWMDNDFIRPGTLTDQIHNMYMRINQQLTTNRIYFDRHVRTIKEQK